MAALKAGAKAPDFTLSTRWQTVLVVPNAIGRPGGTRILQSFVPSVPAYAFHFLSAFTRHTALPA